MKLKDLQKGDIIQKRKGMQIEWTGEIEGNVYIFKDTEYGFTVKIASNLLTNNLIWKVYLQKKNFY